MTTRDLGESGIKFIGVYFGALGLIRVSNVLGSLAMPAAEGLPPGAIAIANTLSITGTVAVAAVCLFFGRTLAERFFPAHTLGAVSVSRRDLLAIGLILFGVSTAFIGIPGVLQFAARIIWYAEASHQSLLPSVLENSWQAVANNALEILLGGILVTRAHGIAAALDRRGGRRSE
jgi:hypothetical protein